MLTCCYNLDHATSQVFKTSDPAYAQSALKHAQELYALANLMPTNTTYCAEVWCGGPGWTRYTSSSVFDDLSLAAAWLYVGTGKQHVQVERPLLCVFCCAVFCFVVLCCMQASRKNTCHRTHP